MLTDFRLQVAKDQLLVAATPFVTESIDLQDVRDPGEGQALWYFLVTRQNSLIDGAFLVELLASASANLGTPTVWLTTSSSVPGGDAVKHIVLPVYNPYRSAGPDGTLPELRLAEQFRYVGLRITAANNDVITVHGTLAPPAISPLHYPASTSS